MIVFVFVETVFISFSPPTPPYNLSPTPIHDQEDVIRIGRGSDRVRWVMMALARNQRRNRNNDEKCEVAVNEGERGGNREGKRVAEKQRERERIESGAGFRE